MEGKIYSNCWLSIAKLTKLKNMEAGVRHCESLLDIERQAPKGIKNLCQTDPL